MTSLSHVCVLIIFLLQGAKASVAMFLLIGLIPFLFGVLLEVIVLTPLRVPLNQVRRFIILCFAMFTDMFVILSVSCLLLVARLGPGCHVHQNQHRLNFHGT